MGRVLVPVIPDGGWGWVIVFGSFLIHVFADGFVYSFGVLVEDIVEEFHASNAYTAIIISLLTGLTLGCGPLASAVTDKYGCRTSTIIGSIVACIGCLISYWADSVMFIIVSVGVVMGVGLGLMYCPAIVIVTMYFEKWRALATGLAVCGAGVGTFLFPQVYGFVRTTWGWRATFLVASVFMGCCALCGATFRPLEFIEVKEKEEEESSPGKSESESRKDEVSTNKEDAALLAVPKENRLKASSHDDLNKIDQNSGRPSLRAHSTSNVDAPHPGHPHHRKRTSTFGEAHHHEGYLHVAKDVFYTGSVTELPEFQQNKDKYRSLTSLASVKKKKLEEVIEEGDDQLISQSDEDPLKLSIFRSFLRTIYDMLNLSLLLEPTFLLFAISNLLTSVGFNSPLYFLPLHATKGLGLSKEQGDFALSCFGVCNTVGRVTFGFVGDKKLPLPMGFGKDTRRNRLWIYIISLAVCGMLTSFSFLFTSFTSLCVYAGLFGFSISSYICLTSVILVDLLGLEKLTNAFGLLLLFQGVGTVFGPPLAGHLADIAGGSSYDWSFVFCGVNLLVSGVIMVLTPCLKPATSSAESASPKEVKQLVPH